MFSQNQPLFLVEVADPPGGGFCRGVLGIGKAGAIHSLSLTDSTLAGPLQVSQGLCITLAPIGSQMKSSMSVWANPLLGPSPHKDGVLGDFLLC